MDHRVAVIIPTHDRPALLAEALRSVLDQTVPPVEIVVVDDLGHEHTRSIVAGLAATTRVELRYLHRLAGPRGASASRNAGAAAATADYVAFLDDDDLWEPGFLADAMAAVVSSGTELVISWLAVLTNGARLPGPTMPERLSPADVIARNPGFTGSNFLVASRVFRAIGGFDASLPVSNDKDFLVRALAATAGYRVVPRRNAIYRKHSGPQLTTWNAQRADGMALYLAKHRDNLTRADRRHLQSKIYGARAGSASTAIERFRLLALSGLVAPPADWRELLARRLPRRGATRANGWTGRGAVGSEVP